MKTFLFPTTERISYAAGWLVQGLVQLGHRVHTSSINLLCDGRLASANLNGLEGVVTARHDGSEDLLLIDETRMLSAMSQAQVNEFYKPIQDLSVRKPVALLYMQDDANFVTFPDGLTVFCTHKNRLMEKRRDTLPLPFGFPQELLNLAMASRAHRKQRSRTILCNFNPTFDQSVRESLHFAFEQAISPRVPVCYEHTQGSEYITSLTEHAAILAYGGKYYQPPTDYHYLRERMSDDDLSRHSFSVRQEKMAIFRWDSYRLWEAWLFGCIPITLDFDRYGFVLPEMPTKWQHYLPINLDTIERAIDEISEIIEKISYAPDGLTDTLEWVSDIYAPLCGANRIIRLLSLV